MQRGPARQAARQELKTLVAETSRALALLDVLRLEDLAASCEALKVEQQPGGAEQRALLAGEARDAAGEMVVLARVLEATRANLKVMQKLRELHAAQIEYTERQARGGMVAEREHGND
jgi:hypothetical protein